MPRFPDDIYLTQTCGVCSGTLIIIPEHGFFVQHEDAEQEADHSVTKLNTVVIHPLADLAPWDAEAPGRAMIDVRPPMPSDWADDADELLFGGHR